MKRSLPLICAFLLLGLSFQSCKKAKTNAVVKVVNITGLFSITGNWSTLGINSKAALQCAVSDINIYLESKNAGFILSASFYDTKLNPDTAKVDFLNATSAGATFIIGPQSSSELSAIVPLADSTKTIVISQGSTAGNLAIAGDPIFRFCPPDKVEGAAIANTIYSSGIKGLVTVARNDAGNLGLQTATDSFFNAKGGVLYSLNPYSTTTTDFTSLIASLKTGVSQLSTTYGIVHTAVYLASFDEAATLFAQAVTDSQLSQVKWYGGDGVVLSAPVLANTSADQFAVRTGFFAPSFGLPESLESQWAPISSRITAITGITPDAFALSAYDAMWVIVNTLLTTQGNVTDFNQLKTVFVQQSNSYIGITGSTTLDGNGDRASGTFDYWGITWSGNTYQWTVVGESQ